jgi:hypothetical protein
MHVGDEVVCNAYDSSDTQRAELEESNVRCFVEIFLGDIEVLISSRPNPLLGS